MKTIIQVALVAAVVALGWRVAQDRQQEAVADAPAAALAEPEGRPAGEAGAEAARQAFEEQARSRQLLVKGRVLRLLADDRDGSPHQRFIIETNSGQSLLVAHNLDLAPRLNGLASGDIVSVYGEYEWNPQGGVMHWTHDDPQGRHVTGYIEWQGRKYQ